MKPVIQTFQEQIRHWTLIHRLGWFELKTKYIGNHLGVLWIFLNPLLQIGVYWFAFGVGLKQGDPINGIPYVYWITVGLISWFFINQSLSTGTSSIYSKIGMFSKMNFPLSIVPSFTVYSQLLEHLVLLISTVIVFQFVGYGVSLKTLQLPYYVFATSCFLISANLFLSALATVVRDVKLLMNAILKFGMFLSPVLWTPDHLPTMIQNLLHLNPIFYLIEGYRSSLLGDGVWFFERGGYTCYFWVLTGLLFVIGSMMNQRLKRNLLDYL